MSQDYIMSMASVLMSYALVPQVVWGFRHRDGGGPVQTALLTTIGLATMSVCGFTLGLYWSAGVWTITTALWACVLWQRIRYAPSREV